MSSSDSYVFCYSSDSQRLTCQGQEVILIFLDNALAAIVMQETELAFFEGQQKVATVGR